MDNLIPNSGAFFLQKTIMKTKYLIMLVNSSSDV